VYKRQDYQVKFNLEWGNGTDSGYTVHLNNQSQTDFDDIRFTEDNKTTELDYWMRNYTSSNNATFWVEVSDSLVNTSTPDTVSIYVYWGNDAVSTTSNGTATFLYFDDFEDNDLSEWTVDNMEIKTDRVLNGNYSAGVNVIASTSYIRWDTTAHYNGIAYHVSVNNQQSLRGAMLIPYTTQDWSEYAGYTRTGYESTTSRLYYFDGTFKPWTSSDDDINVDEWYDYEIRLGLESFIRTDPIMRAYHEEGNTFTLNYDGEEDFHTSADIDPAIIGVHWLSLGTQANYEAWFDDFFVRKSAVDSEPTVSSTGNIENNKEWITINDIEVVFYIAYDEKGLNTFILFLGLCLIPASTLFLVKGGKDDLSQNKVFFFIVMFLIGWGLVIGTIM